MEKFFPFNPLNHKSVFLQPERLVLPFPWIEHIPFASFLVEVLKPGVIVELGVHTGNSYCALCQAVQQNKLPTQCFGIDTWKGDDHAGFYGPEILSNLKLYHDPLYGHFSRLIESTFDEAEIFFSPGSVDLLHIDGCHAYSRVKHDFETWLPKLSPKGIVLLHDTNVHSQDFGVWKLWADIAPRYPSFEFSHGNGLGVLALNSGQPEPLRHFFDLSREQLTTLGNLFYLLGSRLTYHCLNIDFQNKFLERKQQLSVLIKSLDERRPKLVKSSENSPEQRNYCQGKGAQSISFSQGVLDWDLQITKLSQSITKMMVELDTIRSSTCWRLTQGLHKIKKTRFWILVHIFFLLLGQRSLRPIRRYNEYKTVSRHHLFDQVYYLNCYGDVFLSGMDPAWHYILAGALENRDPSRLFNTALYLEQYPELLVSGINPLFHYIRFGYSNGPATNQSSNE
jgi:hypothetical protein